jgi:hypothetical protein
MYTYIHMHTCGGTGWRNRRFPVDEFELAHIELLPHYFPPASVKLTTVKLTYIQYCLVREKLYRPNYKHLKCVSDGEKNAFTWITGAKNYPLGGFPT